MAVDIHDFRLALLKEVCNELRARRTPEYMYTVATIAASTALAFGALKAYEHELAGVFCAVACILLNLGALNKIRKEHAMYLTNRKKMRELAKKLKDVTGLPEEELPDGFTESQSASKSPGYRYSLAMSLTYAACCTIICLLPALNWAAEELHIW